MIKSGQMLRLLKRCNVKTAQWQLCLSYTPAEFSDTAWLPSLTWTPSITSRDYSTTSLQHRRWQLPSELNAERLQSMGLQRELVRSIFGQATSTTYDERKLIGYSPDQMFKVVSQVEDYHKFVPWCVSSTIVKRNPSNYIECDLEVGFQVFVERYTSKIRLNPPHSLTTVTDDSTLFHHLESLWKFEKGPTPESCWLSFHVDFAFKSHLYKHVAGVFFEEVVKHMVDAFIGRCGVLYGPSSLSPSSRPNKSVRVA